MDSTEPPSDPEKSPFEEKLLGRLQASNSRDPTVPCPTCEGRGEQLATGIIYAKGHTGPYAAMLPCHRCGGQKVIPRVMLEWIARGKEIHAYRRNAGLTLHAASQAWGLSPSEVSAMELGRVENRYWRRFAGDTEEKKD